MEITRVGDLRLGWGESLVWDELRQRLYFVDCQASTLHWLDDDDRTLHTFRLPSMPTGIVPTDDGRLVGALDDGLHVIDPDVATTRLVATYPHELEGRCNDACARSVFGDTSGLEGMPDRSTLDADGGLWCALVGGAQLARFTRGGLDRIVPLPVTNPTDVTFGGPLLDRLYVVSIASDASELDGALLVIEDLDAHGRAEPRCTIGSA